MRQFMFQERFRNEGGKFFDAATMKATVNGPVGVQVFTDWVAENKWMPAGVETWDFGKNLVGVPGGDTAMTISWPPYGRWAAGYGTEEKALSWVPKTQIAGKVGYAMPPGGHPQLAAGFALSVAANSKKKVPAYLFIQWLNSQDISIERVQLPYALRDPFRNSHFTSRPNTRAAGRRRREYLAALQAGAVSGLLDLSIIQTDKYEEALRQGISRLWAGEDPKTILDDVAAQWDALTAADRRRQAARRLRGVGQEAQRLPVGLVSQGTAPALAGGRLSRLADRQFKYLAITPAVVDHPADRAVPDRLHGHRQLPEHQHAGGGHLLQRPDQLPAAARGRPLLAGARPHLHSSSRSRCRSSCCSACCWPTCSSTACPAGRCSWPCSCCRW